MPDVEVVAAMMPDNSFGTFRSISDVKLAAVIDADNNRVTDKSIPVVRVAGAIVPSNPITSAIYKSIELVKLCARMLPEIPIEINRSTADVVLIPDIEHDSDFGTFNIRSEVDVCARTEPVNSLRSLKSAAEVCVCATITEEKLISSNKMMLISDVFVCARTDPVRNLATIRPIPDVLLWAAIDPDKFLDVMRSIPWVADIEPIDAVRERKTAISAPVVEDRQDMDAANVTSPTVRRSIDVDDVTAIMEADVCLDTDKTGKVVCDTAETDPASPLSAPKSIELVDA